MDSSNQLTKLVLLSKIDASLAGILSERKKIAAERESKIAAIQAKQTEFNAREKILNERRTYYQTEEKRLKHEQMKLVDRRKALATLSNYKLQQSAQAEIEHASKSFSEQEEALIGTMVEFDGLEATVAKLKTELAALKAELEVLDKDAAAAQVAYDDREKQKSQERLDMVKEIDPAVLKGYERVRGRYPMDAVVALTKGSCGGCFMSLGPQEEVQVRRGTKLVNCRGCGRLLYVVEEK